MNLTTNLGLGKPLGGEDYDVEVNNTNNDIIDGALGDAVDDIAAKRIGGKKIGWKMVPSPGNTDANGFRVYNHAIGFLPTIIVGTSLEPSSNFAVVWGIDTISNTQCRVRFHHATIAGLYVSLPAPDMMFFLAE